MPEQLVSLVYNDLDTEEAKAIQTHLKTCEACSRVYDELKSTTDLLGTWKDSKPEANFVFITESASRWAEWKKKIRQMDWGKRLVFGISAFAAATLLVLAILNIRIDIQDGRWTAAFSLLPRQEGQIPQEQLAEALNQVQSETLLLVSRMLEDSEDRQRQENAIALAQLARDIELQRQRDMRFVGQGIEGLQQSTNGRFAQTSDVLNDLIKLTSYKLERR